MITRYDGKEIIIASNTLLLNYQQQAEGNVMLQFGENSLSPLSHVKAQLWKKQNRM